MLFEVIYTKPFGHDVKSNKYGTFRNNKQLLNWTMVRYGAIATNKRTGEMKKVRWQVFAAQNCQLLIVQPFFWPEITVSGKLSKKIDFLSANYHIHGPASYKKCPRTLSTGLIHITGSVTPDSVRALVL